MKVEKKWKAPKFPDLSTIGDITPNYIELGFILQNTEILKDKSLHYLTHFVFLHLLNKKFLLWK